MQKLFVLAAAFLVLASAAAAPSSDGRIVNGTPASAPISYLAAIQREFYHYCAGFVYNEKWIVTSASCVQGAYADSLNVELGLVSYITPSNVSIFNVIQIQLHPDYNASSKLNDLALLELARSITFVPGKANFIYIGEADESGTKPGTIAGWGATQSGGTYSPVLRTGEVTIPGDCAVYGATYDSSFMICAGKQTDSSGPCSYDQGSPLVQDVDGTEQVVVGIVSMISPTGQCRTDPYYGSLYTRLPPYVTWIRSIAGTQPPPSGR